jgi:hypothetical protein
MERFKEIKEIGRGGFGKTLLVEDLVENSKRVVIKAALSASSLICRPAWIIWSIRTS